MKTPGSIACAMILLCGCDTTTPGSLVWRENSFQQAPKNPKYDEMLFESTGWQIWRRYHKGDFTCIAVKPANAQTAPKFSDDYSRVVGDTGFYIALTDDDPEPFFSFYSEHPFGRNVVVNRDDGVLYNVNDRDTVLAWEGQTIEYSISSQPTEYDYRLRHTQTETMDFSGVGKAYELVQTCYRYSI